MASPPSQSPPRLRPRFCVPWRIYELDRLDFAEAHLIAKVEATGVNEIVSFSLTIDRIDSITQREP